MATRQQRQGTLSRYGSFMARGLAGQRQAMARVADTTVKGMSRVYSPWSTNPKSLLSNPALKLHDRLTETARQSPTYGPTGMRTAMISAPGPDYQIGDQGIGVPGMKPPSPFTRGLIPGDYNARRADELFQEGRMPGLQRMMREGQQFSGGALAELVQGRPEAERRSIENRLFRQGQMGPAATNNYTGRINSEIDNSMFQSPRQPGVGFNAMRGGGLDKRGNMLSGDQHIVPTPGLGGIRYNPMLPGVAGLARPEQPPAGPMTIQERLAAGEVRPEGYDPTTSTIGGRLAEPRARGWKGTTAYAGMPGVNGERGAYVSAQNSPGFQAELDSRRAAARGRGIARADARGVRTGRMSPLEAALGAMGRSGMDVSGPSPMTMGMMFGPQAAIGAMTNQRETAEGLRREANQNSQLEASLAAAYMETHPTATGPEINDAVGRIIGRPNMTQGPSSPKLDEPVRDVDTGEIPNDYVAEKISKAPDGVGPEWFAARGITIDDLKTYADKWTSGLRGFHPRNNRKFANIRKTPWFTGGTSTPRQQPRMPRETPINYEFLLGM